MKNIIKAEFYKLFHGSFLSYCLSVTFGAALIKVFSTSEPEEIKTFRDIVVETKDFMILTIVLTGIFLIHTWSKERKNGYIKNIAGNVNGRHILTVTKLITGAVGVVINSFFSLASVLFNYLLKSVIKGGKVSFAGAFEKASVMRYAEFIIWIVAGIALIAMLLMIYEIFRSAAFGYIMAIQMLMGSGLLEALLAQIAAFVFKFEDLGRYLIVSGTRMMQAEPAASIADGEMYPNSMAGVFIRLCIYIAVFTAVSIFVTQKRDA